MPLNLQQIQDAIAAGKAVYWQHPDYRVRRFGTLPGGSSYFICHVGGRSIPLTMADGKTLNGQEAEFYAE